MNMKKKHLHLVDFKDNHKDLYKTEDWVYTVPKTGLYTVNPYVCKDGSNFHLLNEKSKMCENCGLDVSLLFSNQPKPSLWSRIVADLKKR